MLILFVFIINHTMSTLTNMPIVFLDLYIEITKVFFSVQFTSIQKIYLYTQETSVTPDCIIDWLNYWSIDAYLIDCITNKGKMAKNELENDDSDFLWALQKVY